jgi:uncharacterized LabA/DUF88 family protein
MTADGVPATPVPIRAAVFIDGQNLYHRCRDHFAWPWVHPHKLAQALLDEDLRTGESSSRVLACVRYYTGIHDLARRPEPHRLMVRRLQAYTADGVTAIAIPLRYDGKGAGREKGVDVRIALDMVRFGRKGLFDVAVVVSEDSDLDEAVKDLYALRDHERWIAVENALPHSGTPHARSPRWLSSARRRRPITQHMFAATRDDTRY